MLIEKRIALRAGTVLLHAAEYIFTMYQLKKIAPGSQREILKGITLAFYPTAKIGVLGPNGAGKSTLLRIMAGIDKEYVGDARITEGYRAGLLAQEPQLDASKDVRGNVEEGVADRRAVLKRYEELSGKFGESLSDAEMATFRSQWVSSAPCNVPPTKI